MQYMYIVPHTVLSFRLFKLFMLLIFPVSLTVVFDQNLSEQQNL